MALMNKSGWDYIKHLMASAHCGHDSRCYKDDIENRPMVIAFMKDNYGFYSTIFISLEGSPPKAFAILKTCDCCPFNFIKENNKLKVYYQYEGKSYDKICINEIEIFRSDLTHYKTIREKDRDKSVANFSLEELLSRKDVIIVNSEISPQQIPPVRGRDFKILGWVLLTENGELKTSGVDDVKVENGYIIYNKRRYPPGLYYLVELHCVKFFVDANHFESLLYDESESD